MYNIKQLETVLRQHNFPVSIAADKEEARQIVSQMIQDHEQVACGGSMTLAQCGILQMLEERDISYMPHIIYKHQEEARKEAIHAFTSDVFLCSANAVTMHGEIVSVDGVGNRVANMIYGPKRVILVVGRNKIVADLASAYQRIETVAAPLNNQRLHTQNPCCTTQTCMHCTKETRICNAYVTIAYQKTQRISILIVDEELGY